MEGVELAIPAAVAVPNLMGSEGFGGARANGVGDAEGCDAGRGLGFACPKIEKSSALVSQRAGSEGKQLQKEEGRVPRSSRGCFKTPQTPQLETSMFIAEDVDMKDASDELGSHIIKNSYAARSSLTRGKEGSKKKSQQLKQKNNLNCKRGDRRNSRVPVKTKHDSVAGFSPFSGGNKVFGTYGLKPDVNDITKLIDDISLNEILDGSYKFRTMAKEKGRRLANTSDNILHSVREASSIFQHRGLSQVNKQNDEIDVGFSKEVPSLPTSNICMGSNLDADEENSPASDLSCTKVQESCVNAEAPPNTCDLPLYQPRDVIKKLALPPPKDLDSLLLDPAKPATFSRCNDPRPCKPVSHRVTLSSFSWSHNFNGHSKSNSDSAKVSSRSSCQGRWVRIGKIASFPEGSTESFPDLDTLTYDHSLVPPGSVKYNLLETGKTVSTISSPLVYEQASSSQSPTALHSPRAVTAAQALYDIANSSSKQTTNGFIKWPKQPSEKAMKAHKSKSIHSSENLLTPKTEMTLDNTARFMDHPKPLKKPKLLIFEKRDHADHTSPPRVPHHWSAPRSSRSASEANKHHMNGSFQKPLFMASPRRVSEKTNHGQKKPSKMLQMDWNRGKGQL